MKNWLVTYYDMDDTIINEEVLYDKTEEQAYMEAGSIIRLEYPDSTWYLLTELNKLVWSITT